MQQLAWRPLAFGCLLAAAVAAIDLRTTAVAAGEQPFGVRVILSGPVSTTGVMSERTVRVSLVAAAKAYDTGEPSVSVPARPVRADAPAPTVSRFRMRAWMEGRNARVVVCAVRPSPDVDKDTEERFATVLLAPGETTIIASTEMFGAAPIMVEAAP